MTAHGVFDSEVGRVTRVELLSHSDFDSHEWSCSHAVTLTHTSGAPLTLLLLRPLSSQFTPDRVPIISTLAAEFGVFDRFYAAHPGPTWPNRLFCLTGTAAGCTETGTYVGLFRAAPLVRVIAKFTVRNAVCDILRRQNLTLTRTSGAVLRN